VGGTRRGRCPIPGLKASGSASPYEASAAAWLAGAEPAYRRFADFLVASAPVLLTGKRVLDIGAGTGAACRSLRNVGAVPYAVDESPAMLRLACSVLPGLAVVAADATALPFADGSWDAALTAFCVNHLEQPHLLLAEAGRVVRTGGVVLASTFEEGRDHPVKEAVEEVLLRSGWQPSPWHQRFRSLTSALTATPERLADVARAAGLDDVRVLRAEIDTGLGTPAELVGYRLGMPELAGYLQSLDSEQREAITAEAERAVGPEPEPLRRTILVLTSRAPR
jgi:SAM-dependent methyltransferase